ncbi:MAG: type II toxin-antitoxin system RelE/ParE family toxin [Phycisphaerae bacterium]|nr:type II toxin-antitoxin system RelE/ParE family toxin [Phycisphaerae bacterium]
MIALVRASSSSYRDNEKRNLTTHARPQWSNWSRYHTHTDLRTFAADWKRLRLTDDNLRSLELQLMNHPEAGAVVAGGGGLRKARFAPPSRHTGKSGAMRIAYVFFRTAETMLLLAVFPKNEQANLTAAQKAAFRDVIRNFTT